MQRDNLAIFQPDFLPPSHTLLIHHLTVKPIALRFCYGVIVEAGCFNNYTAKCEGIGHIPFYGDITLHLSPVEKHPGWCYLQIRDEKYHCYRCLCTICRANGLCEHTEPLEHFIKVSR